MKNPIRLALVGGGAAVSAAALAFPITYTASGVGNGSLNGTSFTNAAFSISTTSDTASVDAVNANFHRIANVTTTVSIAGLGSDTLTDAIQIAANKTVSRAGFGDLTNGFAILFVENAALDTYDLTTTIGPVTGPAIFNGNENFATTGGTFKIGNMGDATFTAQAVPEPASLLALAGGAAFVRRRRKA